MDMDTLFEKFERQTHLDLKLNFKKFFESTHLGPKPAGLVALACAESVNSLPLIKFLEAELKKSDTSDEEITEAKDIAAVMGIANNYYRFRHFAKKEAYQKPAGFRMSLMAKPATGKLIMEMMALAVSILNGCESCVEGHEKSVLENGGTEEQVHDLARLASTISGLAVVYRQMER